MESIKLIREHSERRATYNELMRIEECGELKFGCDTWKYRDSEDYKSGDLNDHLLV
ncbi:Enolase [Hexamita inflata]|uniref:Enolase n=1 Tax=Hexamita inflata TaxID=28002 RepID=A0AA86V3B0_9EUKA|nr:Enolase [Hexamita inflata]